MNYNYLLTLQVIADQSLWAVCGKQGAVVNLTHNKKQNIVVEVMPRVGGHLPLPTIRLSKVQIKNAHAPDVCANYGLKRNSCMWLKHATACV